MMFEVGLALTTCRPNLNLAILKFSWDQQEGNLQATKPSVARAVSPTSCHPANPLDRPTKSKPAW